MKTPYPAIRWSLSRAADEFRTTVVRIRRGLKAHGISPVYQNKQLTYATHEIAAALYDLHSLERRAKEANWQRKIDEAEVARAERDEKRRTLIPTSEIQAFLLDYNTEVVQFIRHSPLDEKTKAQLLRNLREKRFGDEKP
jgi:hypothetical protein